MSQDIRHFTVIEDDDGQRLDRWLKKTLPKTPYALLQKMVRTGQVRIDGKRAKTDTRLEAGQSIRIPPAEEKTGKITFTPKQGDKEYLESITLFDDGHVLVLNKPYGLPVQGGPNITRHVDGMLATLRNLKGVQPRLIHRLDRDTSGVLVCGRSLSVTSALGDLFAGRDIKKIYWAVVSPAPKDDKGEIDAALIKGEGSRKEAMIIDPENGKESKTWFRVIERSKNNEAAFVAFWPRTGRMHQIRVHTADGLGCPIIGDEKYGGLNDILNKYHLSGRLHLHAARIVFRHPKTNELMDIKAPLSEDMKETFKVFGFNMAYDNDPFDDKRKDN
jgi:23S rRNA pseudouridine955/2504/2580 synthase